MNAADARKRLWESYLAQARAHRRSGQAGHRFDALAVVAQAVAIQSSVELRSEAASAMALPDLRLERQWEGFNGLAVINVLFMYIQGGSIMNPQPCRNPCATAWGRGLEDTFGAGPNAQDFPI